jgi:hypothetical protein
VFIGSAERGSSTSFNCFGFVELTGAWIASDGSEAGHASWMSKLKVPIVSFDVGTTVSFSLPLVCPTSTLRFRAGDIGEFKDFGFLRRECVNLSRQVWSFIEAVSPRDFRVLLVPDEQFAQGVCNGQHQTFCCPPDVVRHLKVAPPLPSTTSSGNIKPPRETWRRTYADLIMRECTRGLFTTMSYVWPAS